MIKRDCAILIVDNDPVSGSLLAQQIAGIPGMSVSACLTDGNHAVEYLWAHPVDILITEIDLPGINGLELIAYCRKYKVGCTPIVVSAVRNFDSAIQALHYRVINYLPKPPHFTQLAEALEIARSELHLTRRSLLVHGLSPCHDLEQAICASFRTGASPELWSEQLNKLLTAPGQLLRISHQTPISETRDFAFATYSNLLSHLFRDSVILSICREPDSELFLLIPNRDYPVRTIQSLRRWFAHVITHEVTLTLEGTVERADQLAALAMTYKVPDHNKIIEMACAYMQSHLSEPLSRKEVASEFYLSPSHFSYLFKKVMGVCYNEYLTDLRISNAKIMLSQNIPIREVAAAAGFRSVKYFGEVFLKKTGYMPTEYRRGLLNGTVKQKE